MTTDESKLEILRKVENGTLSVEEGSDLIGIIENAEKMKKQETKPVETISTEPGKDEKQEPTGCWKAAWSMILLAGAVLTAFSAFWIYQGYKNNGFSWGFWLSWIPLVIGIAITIFGWILMESPWLHIRIKANDKDKKANLNFFIPLPLRKVSWVFKNFGHMMPDDVKDKGIPEMI